MSRDRPSAHSVGVRVMKYGYRWDREDKWELRHASLSGRALLQRSNLSGPLFTVDDPTKYYDDPGQHVTVEDQQQLGSCVGHGGTTTMEWCYFLATGSRIELNRMYAYVASQRIAGIRGDNGSTVAAMATLAKRGVPLEEAWPYTGRYTTQIPASATQSATNKIASTTDMESYDVLQQFLGRLMGGVCIGVKWGASFDRGETVEQFNSGERGGGHCVSLPFLSPRKDSRGRHYVWLANSWSERWGNRGFKEVAPTAIDAMIRHQWSEFSGFSDMVVPESRVKDLWDLRRK